MSQGVTIKGVWPWLLLFSLAFLCFFGRLWVNQFLEIKLQELTQTAGRMGIKLEDLRLIKLPPSLQLDSIEIPVRGKTLLLYRPSLELGLLPLRLMFSAKFLGGSVNAVADLELGNPPMIPKFSFTIDKLLMKELFTLTKMSEFGTIENGYLNGSGTINIKYKNSVPDWSAAEGAAGFELKNCDLTLKLPLLKKDKIANIHGNAHIHIQGAVLELESCRVTALPIFFEADGKVVSWYSPKKAMLQLRTELRLPVDLINASFFPERTRAAIQQKGMARAKIAGQLFSPKIYLEN